MTGNCVSYSNTHPICVADWKETCSYTVNGTEIQRVYKSDSSALKYCNYPEGDNGKQLCCPVYEEEKCWNTLEEKVGCESGVFGTFSCTRDRTDKTWDISPISKSYATSPCWIETDPETGEERYSYRIEGFFSGILLGGCGGLLVISAFVAAVNHCRGTKQVVVQPQEAPQATRVVYVNQNGQPLQYPAQVAGQHPAQVAGQQFPSGPGLQVSNVAGQPTLVSSPGVMQTAHTMHTQGSVQPITVASANDTTKGAGAYK